MSQIEAAQTDAELRSKLEAVIAGCEGVTPGPWEAESSGGKGAWIKGSNGEWAALACGDDDDIADRNAAHIARLDPDFVRQMATLALSALAPNPIKAVPEGWLEHAAAKARQSPYVDNGEDYPVVALAQVILNAALTAPSFRDAYLRVEKILDAQIAASKSPSNTQGEGE